MQQALELVASPWAGYCSRYVRYCQEHGATSVDEMMEWDRERWPGGCMTGYILWIMKKWGEYRDFAGLKGPPVQADHDAFDAWLAAPSSPGAKP